MKDKGGNDESVIIQAEKFLFHPSSLPPSSLLFTLGGVRSD